MVKKRGRKRAKRRQTPQQPNSLPTSFFPPSEIDGGAEQSSTKAQADQESGKNKGNRGQHMNITDFFFDSVYQIVTWVCIALAIGAIWYFLSKDNWRGIMWSACALLCTIAIMISILADRHFFRSVASEGGVAKQPPAEQALIPHPDRAYIVLTKGYLAEPPKTGNYPISTLEFQNTGNTPAVNVRISCNYSRLKEKAREQAQQGIMPGIPASPFGSAAVIGKGQVFKFITEKGEWNHPESRRLWMNGTFVQYLWGDVYYEDVFGQKHITHFCVFSESPDSHMLTFCLHGNSMEDTDKEPNRLGESPTTSPQASVPQTTPLSIADRPYVVVESAYIPDLVPNRPISPVITIVNKGRTPAQHLAMSLEIAAKPGFIWVLGFGEDSGRRPVSIAFLAPGDKISVGGAPADAVTLDSKFFNDAMEGKESFMIHGQGSYEDMTGREYPIEYAFGYHATARAFIPDFGGPNRVEKWHDAKKK